MNDTNCDDTSDIKNEDQSTEQKPKVRRRGSELSILEQWGWHKNRRSARKKSIQPDQGEAVDTTIKGFLKKILPNFFQENSDSNEPIDLPDDIGNSLKLDKSQIKSEEMFNDASKLSFADASKQELADLISHLKVIEFYISIYMY